MTELGRIHNEAYRTYKFPEPEITTYFLDSYTENIDRSPELREARAMREVFSHCTIEVAPHEQLAGRFSHREPVMFNIGSGVYINHLADEYINALNERQKADFCDKLELVRSRKYLYFWEDGFSRYYPDLYTGEQQNSMRVGAATSTFFGGHMVLDYERLVTIGLGGYERDIQRYSQEVTPENPEFYEAMATILEGFRILILRTADECDKLTPQAKHMADIAADLRHIAYRAPDTFRQALHLIWFAHICNDSDTFGRIDKYLYTFYERDIADATMTREYARTLIESLVIKIDQQESIQNMTVGGILEDGSSNYTELTRMVMEVTAELGYKGPNLCLRINEIMPQEYYPLICECLAQGQGLPALYNDGIMIAYLLKLGIPLEEARDFCLAGCSQVMIGGRSQFVNDIGLMNILKIFELTCYNGIDKSRTGIQSGLVCGGEPQYPAFDDFLRRFKEQITYFSRLEAEINNIDVKLRADHEGYTLRSLFTRDCLQNGRGCFHRGARYNNIQLECIGLTNCADALMGIKKAVYDDKIVTLPQLINAMESDWKDAPDLQAYLRYKVPKFGNDNAEVDELRRDITDYLFTCLHSHESVIGGTFIPGEVIFVVHDPMGAATGATPDGRGSGEVLADSAGASQGRDLNGPTALMNSAVKIPTDKAVTSIILNIKFMKSTFTENMDKMAYLLKSYFDMGGQQIQVNVLDRDILLNAYENPEKFPSLVVRVGGYSAYFNTLSRTLQKDIVDRTSN